MIEGKDDPQHRYAVLLNEIEIPNPHTEGPKVMVSCVGIGTITGAIFLMVLLFVAGDIDKVINSSAGPILQILIHSTQNRAGGICLLMYVFFGGHFEKD